MAEQEILSLITTKYTTVMTYLTTIQDALTKSLQSITDLVSGGVNINIDVPISSVTIPTTPPNADLLQFGVSGVPASVETAIWQRGAERLKQQMNDELNAARAEWAALGRIPDGTLNAKLQYITDKYAQAQMDLNRDAAVKSYDVAANFSIVAFKSVMDWSVAMINAQIAQNDAVAQLRLKEAEVAVRALEEDLKFRAAAAEAQAGLLAQVAAAALTSVSAQVSAHDSYTVDASKRTTTITRAEETRVIDKTGVPTSITHAGPDVTTDEPT